MYPGKETVSIQSLEELALAIEHEKLTKKALLEHDYNKSRATTIENAKALKLHK